METLKNVYYEKFPSSLKLISYFEEGTKSEFCWENITKRNLICFVSYLKERLAKSTVRVYCSRLKTIITLYSEEFSPPKDY